MRSRSLPPLQGWEQGLFAISDPLFLGPGVQSNSKITYCDHRKLSYCKFKKLRLKEKYWFEKSKAKGKYLRAQRFDRIAQKQLTNNIAKTSASIDMAREKHSCWLGWYASLSPASSKPRRGLPCVPNRIERIDQGNQESRRQGFLKWHRDSVLRGAMIAETWQDSRSSRQRTPD